MALEQLYPRYNTKAILDQGFLRYMPPAGISVLLSVLCVRAIRQSENINVPLAVEDLDLYGDQRGASDGRE